MDWNNRKTTLIGAVCHLIRPTAGEIQVFGHHHESREARRLVGLAVALTGWPVLTFRSGSLLKP